MTQRRVSSTKKTDDTLNRDAKSPVKQSHRRSTVVPSEDRFLHDKAPDDHLEGATFSMEQEEGHGEGFLGHYLHEMARLSTFTPEQEMAFAKALHNAEVALWVHLFSYVPIAKDLQENLKETGVSHWAAWTEWKRWISVVDARSVQKKIGIVQELAHAMHDRDLDRKWIGQVLASLHDLKAAAGKKHVAFFSKMHQIQLQIQSQRAAFIRANLRLVVSIARRYYHGKMSLADLIQEGNLGLMKAVERFNYQFGYRFSTYASWWIRHAISRSIADKGRDVRVPVHTVDLAHRLSRSKQLLLMQLGRVPTNEELSKVTGIDPEKIEKMNVYLLEHSFSIDQRVSEEDPRSVADFLEDPAPSAHPMDQLVDKTVHAEIQRLLKHLSALEADILKKRFALGNHTEEMTLQDIGKKYRLSRERIRQIESKALGKLRDGLAKKGLL